MNQKRLVILAMAMILLAATVATDPYASHDSDPFAISVKSVARAQNNFTVEVTVTDKTSGKVVFAPKVNLKPGTPAEVLSNPDEQGVSFEVRVNLLESGKANVTFKAYKNVLQRTRVSA